MQRNSILASAAAAALSMAGSLGGSGPEPGQGQLRARKRLDERRKETASISHATRLNLPGETNRQFAARMRAEQPAPADKPTASSIAKFADENMTPEAKAISDAPPRPKRVRAKKVAA